MPLDEDLDRSPLRRHGRSPVPWIVGAIALVAAAVAAWWWLVREPELPPPPAPVAAPSPEPTPSPEPAAAPVEPLTPERTRALLEAISSNPLFRRAIGDAPERRTALVASNVAADESPRKPLALAAPAGAFSVVERGGRKVIAPASYARYDAFADAVASVDAAKAAQAYRAMHAPIEAAYRALGYPQGAVDEVVRRALQRIAAAPVRDGDVEVALDEGVWVYADDRLEGLGDVEKHVLRMGPRNGRKLQAKARELLAALGLVAAPPR